jgi:hypothetical protein
MAEKFYFNIDFKSGNFYESSKTPKEGFDTHTNTKGDVSYRRYASGGVYGTFVNAGIRASKIGDQCSITVLTENGDTCYLNLGIYTVDGNIENNFMESLIKLLPNLQKGENYLFYPFSFTPEKKEGDTKEPREIKGFTIKTADNVKIEKAYTNAYKNAEGVVTEGDIPYLDFAQRPDGKIRPTAATQEAKTNTLITFMMQEIGKEGRLAWKKGDPSTGGGSGHTPFGRNVAAQVPATPVAPAPVATQSEKPIIYQQVDPQAGAIQPNTAFGNPTNVAVVTADDLDDEDDLPF